MGVIMSDRKYAKILVIKREDNRFVPYELRSGQQTDDKIYHRDAKICVEQGKYIGRTETASGNLIWRKLKPEDVPDDYTNPYDGSARIKPISLENPTDEEISKELKDNTDRIKKELKSEFIPPTDDEVRKLTASSYAYKPDELEIDELNWKLGYRAGLRGEGILFLGYSGCGKTLTARSLSNSLNKPFFFFNMGAMQDARSALIGNTHYSTDRGTWFAGSQFIRAITTENALVLLDEGSRMSPDAENIMMTVLDHDQRYVRLDEDPNTPLIEVAAGVTFAMTANVGAEFTATRLLDRATLDRFPTVIEVPLLDFQQEVNQMKLRYPEVNKAYVKALAELAIYTRDNVSGENPTLTTLISTRMLHQMCDLAIDGFRYSEIIEARVIPMFDNAGGASSERGEIRQFAQKNAHLDRESSLQFDKRSAASAKNLFDVDGDQF